MKMRWFVRAGAVLVLSGWDAHLSVALAQGALTPPGPPGPTMVTLSQIEPRTPIASLPWTITSAGSYFVTTNLTGLTGTNGITIAASSVTLDLRGFTLTGVTGSLTGIFTSGTVTNVTVENGTLSGWGAYGVDADSSVNSLFFRLNAVASRYDGLDVGRNSLVRECTATGNTENGFGAFNFNDYETTFEDCDSLGNGGGFVTVWMCTFLNCRAHDNVNDGFDPGYQCVLRDCSAGYNGNVGIWMPYSGCVADRCMAGDNGNVGIATDHGTLNACTATYNNGNGIDAGAGSALAGCVANFNGGQGINTLDYCTLSGCTTDTNGLDNVATGFGCSVFNCASSESSTGNGFTLGSGNTISDSTAFGNAVNGIDAGDRSTVRGCTATMNGTAGIHLNFQGTAQQCTSGNNGRYGILSDANGYASILDNNCSYNGILTFGGVPTQGAGICITNSPGCRIEANTLDQNYAALLVAPTNHALVLRNSANGNAATNYAIGPGNSWGPIVDVSAGGDISAIPNSSHPAANFIH